MTHSGSARYQDVTSLITIRADALGSVDHRLLAVANKAGERPVEILHHENHAADQNDHDTDRQARGSLARTAGITGKSARGSCDAIEREKDHIWNSVSYRVQMLHLIVDH